MGARDVLGLLWLFVGLAGAEADTTSVRARGALTDTTSAPTSAAFRDTVVRLPEVRVEENRRSAAARRLPTAFVTELEVGASGRGGELIPELLRQAPSVHVQQYGGLGAFSVMSVRGNSPGQLALFLDGTPLTSAAHAVVSLADLPATAIERIEIYRGPSPLGLGQAGAGGAVNLVTARATRWPELRLVRGSFGTWEGRGTAQVARNAVAGLLHLGYQGSAGDFTYHDDNATWFNLEDDDPDASRRNNRFDALTGLGSVTWNPRADLGVVLRGDYFQKRQGLPGLGATPARHAALSFQRALSQLEISMSPGQRGGRATLRAGLARERTRFRDLHTPPELGLGYHDTDDRVRNDHLDLELEWPLPGGATLLKAGGALRREEARLEDRADGVDDPPRSRRDSNGAMLGLQIRPLGQRIVLHVAERWDRTEDALRSVAAGGVPRATDVRRVLRAPQLGASLAAGLGLELRANWSKAQRPPDFLELFGNQGSVRGSPSLQPEQVESWDAGGSWSSPRGARVVGSITWAHFESRARDLILYVRSSQSSVRAENVLRARVRGEEVGVHAALWGIQLTGSFTWQDAVDASDVSHYAGKRLPQRPAREGYARLSWERRILGLGADLHTLGDNYLDRYNTYRVARRTLTSAWLSVTPSGWPLRLVLEGKNLGDQQAADVAGFPLPGRSVFLACESRLGQNLP